MNQRHITTFESVPNLLELHDLLSEERSTQIMQYLMLSKHKWKAKEPSFPKNKFIEIDIKSEVPNDIMR